MEKPRTDPWPDAELNPAAEAAPKAARRIYSQLLSIHRAFPEQTTSDCTQGQRAGQKSGEEESGFEEGSNEPFLGRLSALLQSSAGS